MENIENVVINSYEDFISELNKIKESETSAILSFYKYCYLYSDESDLKSYRKLIIEEVKSHGLIPYKVTKDINLIFRYKRKAEAVMYIKPYGVDLCIYRR